jgi:hypothetical protein
MRHLHLQSHPHAPHVSKPRCGVCKSGFPTKNQLNDPMMLMRLRYKLLSVGPGITLHFFN